MLAIQGSNAGKHAARHQRESDRAKDSRGDAHVPPSTITNQGRTGAHYSQVSIGTLPDVALLEIFNFYVDETGRTVGWHKLVHVCRRWRHIVFASLRRLRLQLRCTGKTPVREMLDVWPVLPIVISDRGKPVLPPADSEAQWGADSNIIAALEHHDRVREIDLRCVSSPLLERFATMVWEPYTELTSLELRSNDDSESAPVLPDSFVGGSVPRLRKLSLDSIAFPGLSTLLFSTSHLVRLHLHRIPNSGYISPDAMVACLSTTNSLESLTLEFHSPRSRPGASQRPPPPLTRALLPSLTRFRFYGASEYLEDLLARVDAPQLNFFCLTFFNQLSFDLSQLPRFVSRTNKIKEHRQAALSFYSNTIEIALLTQTRTDSEADRGTLVLRISCRESDWQLSSVAQLCSSALLLQSAFKLERLSFYEHPLWSTRWQGDMESTQWMEFLRPFTAVKSLYLSKGIALRVARALEVLARGGAVTEILPALQRFFVEGLEPSGSVQGAIEQFIAARQLSDHPVTVERWV